MSNVKSFCVFSEKEENKAEQGSDLTAALEVFSMV